MDPKRKIEVGGGDDAELREKGQCMIEGAHNPEEKHRVMRA